MGQILKRIYEEEQNRNGNPSAILPKTFPDLSNLPPELGLLVLSHLNATDLCLAACVWQDLANDEMLWMGLCRTQWGYVSIYRRMYARQMTFKKLYLLLDEGTLTFNADWELGIDYFFRHGLLDDRPADIALFLHRAKMIDWDKRRAFLASRGDVLAELVRLQNYENQFLPNALRKFFNETHPPNERSDYLSQLVDQFSERFVQCNPRLGFSKDTVYLLCYSLIMLSVDLNSPHVKNKMSKREFIRNTRHAAHDVSEDLAGHLYDNIYLIGHVAPKA